MTAVETDELRLREFIRTHQVCYDVWPELVYVDGIQRQTGFAIELCGTHEHPEHVSPGCHECHVVNRRLAELGAAVIPRENTDSRYPIEPFDPVIRYPSKRQMRPEVQVTIRIAHKHDFLSPLDDCERRCLSAISRRLEGLGVGRGSFHEHK